MNDEKNLQKNEVSEEKHHKHEGKFSENLLDKQIILKALDIKRGQTIVDAGCGNGYMSKAFSGPVDHGKVYALDHDRHQIGLLEQAVRGTNIVAMECDLTQPIRIDRSSADIVYISTVLHGFSKAQVRDFLREAKRILKPEGILAVVEIEKKETPFGPPMNIRFSPEELNEIVPMIPLETVQVGDHFYMQIFRNTK